MKKTTQKRKQKKIFKVKRLFIYILGTMLLFAGFLTWFFLSYDSEKTYMKIGCTAPSTERFLDSNYMVFDVKDTVPDVNNNRELTPIDSVTVSYNLESGFFQPAFKMNINNKDLSENVKISPFIKGTWRMYSDSEIVFTPETDWPADKKFTVKINKSIVNPDIDVDSYKVSFTTPEIESKIESFNLYPAPDNKKALIGIAVITFNYPINTKNFEDKISLKLDDEKLGFTVKFDKFRRTAFIISDPVSIKNDAQIIRLKINKISALNGDSATRKITAHATIESADNIFKISSISTVIADDKDGNAQQLVLINTTTAVAENTDWDQFINVYLLPEHKNLDDEGTTKTHIWSADEITTDILEKSEKLPIKKVDFANPSGVYQYAFSYNVSDKRKRYIYVNIKNGLKSLSDFPLKNSTDKVLLVVYPKAEVKIAGTGALLSLSGEKKLGIMARGGVDTAYVNLYKVKSSEINHLISQTYNVFASDMEFKSWSFGVYDMSVVFQKKISFSDTSMKATNYASVDLGEYLDRTQKDKTGIFIIQTGASENEAQYNDKRLILLTDLGIIRKVNLDESSIVFISTLSDGLPAKDIEIYVLGRNGNAIWAGRTDEDGRADIPKFAWEEYRNAREPVAIVAKKGNDVSFIPYNAYNQQVEYSKFDIDGEYQSYTNSLNAFLFSDRGVYRPGENIILGGIIKNKDFQSLSGIPIKIEIQDSRGRVITEKNLSLTASGMFDIQYDIPVSASIGQYVVQAYSLNSKNLPENIIGTTTFRVEEFVPDTMKITATISGESDEGWLSPENLVANVSLYNLFGTPAMNRDIKAQAILSPVKFSFPEYSEYTFTPNFLSDTGLSANTFKRNQTFIENLSDIKTDENGNAVLNVKFNQQVPDGTYKLTLNIKGFEAGSGKSVQTSLTTRVSDFKYLIGYSSNADLSYINLKSERKVKLIAIDHTATPITVKGLTKRLIKRENLTSLVKDYNDYYKYQTVTKDKIISQTDIDVLENGSEINLDTTNAGTYILQILDASDKILANIDYFVAGDGNLALESDTKAELEIRLDSSEYKSNQDISVNITAPYTGTGLITIERDKVYAYKWFVAETTSSVQKIRIPKDFEGTGYVNVSFVRDINSRDIFTTPYTYAVAPFTADISKRKININLSAPKTISNDKLKINFSTSESAKLMLFAVNQGILQVANYQIPNPLAHFFKKSALQVNTYQILSLLLPEYKILRQFAQTGGGDYESFNGEINQVLTNPFGRKTLPSVAFYSGIINTKANENTEITFDIPEYFNGEIKVFAVAANKNAMGSADTSVLVQSPIIISANTPVVVAPNDTFDINAVISNLTENSGATANAYITTESSENISITSQKTDTDAIPENTEKTFNFSAKANDILGNGEIFIKAEIKNSDEETLSSRKTEHTLSVRPVTTFTTDIQTDKINSERTKIKISQTDMYTEYHVKKLLISSNLSVIAMPLFSYLSKYEFTCSEQLVSKALPYALLPEDAFIGTTYDESAKVISNTINLLKNRQNDDGSFSLWETEILSRNNESNTESAYLTAYIVQFLTIAKENGFNVPKEMLSRSIDFLRSYSGGNIENDFAARTAAFAIYVITANGYVTTSYIDLFEEYANENMKNWRSEISGAYIAAAYKMLRQDDLAESLIQNYKISNTDKIEYISDFNNNVVNDAIYYYLSNKYFSSQNISSSGPIISYINSGNYTAYTSASIIMAAASNKAENTEIKDINIYVDDTELKPEKKEGYLIVNLPYTGKTLEINCKSYDKETQLFYTLLQQGYPKKTVQESNGIEIIREYYDTKGNRIETGKLGDTITVKIFARTRGGADNVPNVVITDLLAGGLVIDNDTINGEKDFSEVREDRVIIYTSLSREGKEFSYTAQLGTVGQFQVPPIHAESMYNPQIKATGKSGTLKILNDTSL